MAKKKEEKKAKIVLERTYNVPLRKEWLKVTRHRRSKKAVKALREFIVKHMKVEDENIKMSKYLNEKVWSRGIQNPPHHIQINVQKDSDGIVNAELVGAPVKKELEKEAKKKKGKGILAKRTESSEGMPQMPAGSAPDSVAAIPTTEKKPESKEQKAEADKKVDELLEKQDAELKKEAKGSDKAAAKDEKAKAKEHENEKKV